VRPATALRRGLYTLCALYFVLWACGPALSGPPPVPMAEGRTDELGLAPHVGLAWSTQMAPTTRCEDPLISLCAGPSGQLWYRHRFEHFDLGGTLFGGRPTLLGGGALFRWRFYEKPAMNVALQADAGLLWGALGVPVSWALSDRTWLTLHPQMALKTWAPLRLGAGLTHTTNQGLLLGLEAGAGTALDGIQTIDLGGQVGIQF
jgi:hypothetical protein